jgi:hypothetical protein
MIPPVPADAAIVGLTTIYPVLTRVLLPPEFVAVRETEKIPGTVYWCVAFRVVAVPPSPKSQYQDVGLLVELSVNVTVRGAVPEVGVPVNPATGTGPRVGVGVMGVVGPGVYAEGGIPQDWMIWEDDPWLYTIWTLLGALLPVYVSVSPIDQVDQPVPPPGVLNWLVLSWLSTRICSSLFAIWSPPLWRRLIVFPEVVISADSAGASSWIGFDKNETATMENAVATIAIRRTAPSVSDTP